MTTDIVYLDTEGTGLDSGRDAMLEIAIVDDAGHVLLDSLIAPPAGMTEWPQAQAIHGITPSMVAGAPSLTTLAPKIEAAVRGRDVVIYNAAFDTGFLGALLDSARSVQCCMEAWSEYVNEWDHRHGHLRWHRLSVAAAAVQFEWPGNSHRALADSLACRAVWRYLHSPAERERVDILSRSRQLEKEARYSLRAAERRAEINNDRWRDHMTAFLETWWLRRYGTFSHWSRGMRVAQVSEELALLFCGKPLALIKLEEQVPLVFTSRYTIPDDLRPASHFLKEKWYQAELIPSAAYIGKKTGWLLYSTTEEARLRALYPLRLEAPERYPGDALLNRTDLLKCGLTVAQIALLKPVAERQNGFSGEWFSLYQVEKNSLPNPEFVPLYHCTPEQPAGESLPVETVLSILKSQKGEIS